MQLILLASVLRAIRAAVALISHTGLVALVLFAIKALEVLTHDLWGVEQPVLFGKLPLQFIFDTMDGSVLTVFGYYGVSEAIRAFQDRFDGR
jgi:hypothetical protein